ncbi:hypothetical protein [Caulobacter sp. SSI4214]|uniref:hypothetical protein n=1 Tax=Caulobacter sp. SSI4214 TaxID=2575739 RepID=UPI00143C75D8|nr:hypothetical protein [Caulobacter sp. SSI4214]
MARETVRVRLDQIEAFLPAMAVQVEALRLLFGMLMDFDLDRSDDLGGEPLVVPIAQTLEAMLDAADPEATEPGAQIKVEAIAAALRIIGPIETEEVDIEIGAPNISPGPGAANDD